MTASPSRGAVSRVSMGTVGTAVASYSEIYEFLPENLAKKLTIHDTQGISGTRQHNVNRIADAQYVVSGQITLQPGPYMLGNPSSLSGYASQGPLSILSRIMGGNPSSNVWKMAESPPQFDVLIDKGAQRHVYSTCMINKATFSARAGGPLTLVLDILGLTETTTATAFPVLNTSTDLVYMWAQDTATFNSVSSVATDWQIVIDNKVIVRYANSLAGTAIYSSDQIITMSATVPYTADYLTLYGMNSANANAASTAFTSGSSSLTFTAGAWAVPDNAPTVQNKGEIFLKLTGELKKSGATDALAITNVGV